jgi:cell wall assembly regulator SMI1
MPQFVNTAPAVNATDFIAIERRLGIAFPADLRDHYLAANGGRPIQNIFRVHGDGYHVHQFTPVLHGKRLETVEDVFEFMQEDERLPQMAIAFAIDAGGDWYCYSIAPDTYGRIFYWQSDYFEEPERAVCWLANSLAEFLRGLAVE